MGRFIGHIHQAGEQLLALTNNVLDLSRSQPGYGSVFSVQLLFRMV